MSLDAPTEAEEWKPRPKGLQISEPPRVDFRSLTDRSSTARECSLIRPIRIGRGFKLGNYKDDPTQEHEHTISPVQRITQCGDLIRVETANSVYELKFLNGIPEILEEIDGENGNSSAGES